jgi:hypothetical protein
VGPGRGIEPGTAVQQSGALSTKSRRTLTEPRRTLTDPRRTLNEKVSHHHAIPVHTPEPAFRDPDPDSTPVSGSGSRRAKMTHKNFKKLRNFMFEVLDVLFED